MKTIYLVGESLPQKCGTAHEAAESELAAFDSRHGVFPNLVAKPLLSALYFLTKEGAELQPLFDQLDPLMTHTNVQRRFNVFVKKASKDPFRVAPDLQDKLAGFNLTDHLWLVFGTQTCYGLLGYMCGKFTIGKSYKKGDILKFAREFLKAAGNHASLPDWFPKRRATQRTAWLGLLHRLCTEADDENRIENLLRSALKEVGAKASGLEVIIKRLRSMVPLLHNEAYQDRYAIGYNQAHFVLCEGVEGSGETLPQLYWRVMGKALADRLRGNWVKR